MKPPYFPFYVKDFAGDDVVELMCTEAVGAYVFLLCKAWQADPPASLPDNDAKLARWARVTLRRWMKLRAEVLAAFEKRADGRLYQKRLEAVYKAYMEKSEKARRSALARWSKAPDPMRTHSGGIAKAMQRASDSTSDSGSSEKEGESEGEGPEEGPPEGPPEPLRSSLTALDKWAMTDRRHPLDRARGEASRLAAFLEELEDSPPVLRGQESLPVAGLVPLAVQVITGQAKPPSFKNVAFALGCVRNQLQEWQAKGMGEVPETAEQRWERMRKAGVVKGPRPGNNWKEPEA